MIRPFRERSRSRRPEGRRTPGAPPLADFLLERGILDERSVDLLRRAPRELAEDALLSLGPEVRNPSAFVTQRLAGAATAQAPQAQAGEVLMVHCNGEARPLPWRSQGEAVAELLAWGVLDEGSADFLLKAPEREAREAVASLGPEVRNPSAFLTRRLRELRAAEAGALPAAPAAGAAAPRGRAPAAAQGMELIPVHCGGAVQQLPWACKEQAAELLVSWGVLDEGSADFLLKAPEREAREIVAALGPDVRNPSAFVTRKLKGLQREGALAGVEAAAPPAHAETVLLHHNGAPLTLRWFSKEQALGELVGLGVLDEGSADFLLKAPEREAKGIVASLGPDVRNPSAFVTRKMKELGGGGGPWEPPGQQPPWELPRQQPPWEPPRQQPPQQGLVVHHNGVPITLEWTSAGRAIGQLVGMGVLDEGSAGFLGRLPEEAAKEILSALGPEVRNPSAFVTRKVKAALQGDVLARPVEQFGGPPVFRGGEFGGPPVFRGGELAAPAVEERHALHVYHNGGRVVLAWHSQAQALEELVARGILDQRSADFLAKVPEGAAREIVASLGPDVRNPSAFVTKEVKKWLS